MSSEGNAVAIPAPVDLADLASRITALGDSIKTLKSSSEPDKVEISNAVAALMDAKRTYAKNNGGIGIDGNKWEEPMSKSEKKKAEKAAKAAAAAASAGGTGGDESNHQAPSKKAAAKEAKKAAKKEAKKNFKEGGATSAPAAAASAPAAVATIASPRNHQQELPLQQSSDQ